MIWKKKRALGGKGGSYISVRRKSRIVADLKDCKKKFRGEERGLREGL